jgi:hypothetical protein
VEITTQEQVLRYTQYSSFESLCEAGVSSWLSLAGGFIHRQAIPAKKDPVV